MRVVEINPNNSAENDMLPWTFSKDFLELPGWQEKGKNVPLNLESINSPLISNLLFSLGYASTKYRSFKIKENDSIYNQGEFDKLKKLFNLHLHGAKFTITKAYAVHNPCKQTALEPLSVY